MRRITIVVLSIFAVSFTLGLIAPAISRAETVAKSDVREYTVTGDVVRLPAEGQREIIIKHDKIIDYRDSTGNVVGMNAMTMPFWLSDPALAKNLKPGDRVQFTLKSQWHPMPSEQITAIHRMME